MSKSPEMEDALEKLGRSLFGRSRKQSADEQSCICCGESAKVFRDEVSRKEFELSRLCQSCQDSVFDRNGNEPWQQELT